MYEKSIHWFRRDLRLVDNRALFEACLCSKEVIPLFVFDSKILNELKSKNDKRVYFIFESLMELKKELMKYKSTIILLYGDPVEEVVKFCNKHKVNCVFTNKDYESYAKDRDQKIKNDLKGINIDFLSFKDSVIFEENEIVTQSGEGYKVFTPYQRAWLKTVKNENLNNYEPDYTKLTQYSKIQPFDSNINLESIGFQTTSLIVKPGRKGALEKLNIFANKITSYDTERNNIDLEGTSQISIYLRFGLISIRELFRFANRFPVKGAEIWKSELIWREFYHMILSQYPFVEKMPFKQQLISLKWEGNKEYFVKWCEGQTGFPIVDAAMRYFNKTGWMHNRLRMIVASFLTKDLLIDYKWGEEYFAQKLLDYDLAANNGGWQWCASTGCDAQPYFRIFNPESQSKKFDPLGIFIKKNCPELGLLTDKYIHAPHKVSLENQKKANCRIGIDYPFPIVDHNVQRLKAIQMFKK